MLQPTTSSFDVSVPHFKRGYFTDFSLLAWGGEGAVEKADHNTLGYVAIKTFPHPVPLEGIKEISILVKSRHPNIVHLFGILIDEYADRQCGGYIMEFMQLGSLSAIIHNSAKEYDKKQVYLWIEQVGRGLKYLHEKNIIHRDIKPQNMLLLSMDHLKLADFGLSRDIVEDKSITGGLGTCLYMAPEVIKTRRYGNPADIYSFAISIWEMIHRLKPYSEYENAFDVQTAVLEGKRPLLDLSKIDPETEILLQRGWSEKPAERVTIVEIIGFARRRSLVNIEGNCQLVMQPENNENGIVAIHARIIEYPSTILSCSTKKMFIWSKNELYWRTLSLELPFTHSEGGFAYLNGEIYIFGGEGLKRKNRMYKFGHQKKWIRLADMNEKRCDISNSTVVYEGCIWVIGGGDTQTAGNGKGRIFDHLNTVEKYTPEGDKWIQMPKMQLRRVDAAAAICDGKIYVSGGCNDDDELNSVECFDPKTNIWTMFVDLPTPLFAHSMISDGSSLIVLGGFDVQKECNTVWKINTKEENPTWKPMPSMMEARYSFSAVLLENRIYAVGGDHNKTVEIFNGSSWEAGPNLPGSSYLVSAVIPSHLASALLLL